jgi:aspartate kinase
MVAGNERILSVSGDKKLSETIVLKFGGSSVGSPDRIQRVARIVTSHRKHCARVVVVVSAMGDTTDELIDLAKKVSPQAQDLSHRREMDMLLSTGERISMALLSMALSDLNVSAISLTGSQSGIITTSSFGEACIREIRPIRILESLEAAKVVIVAGFQGVSQTKEITTLGRGGSDTSAVALAIALKAKECVIYTDVDGYYSADPRKVENAQKIEKLSWELAIEGAARGAQVLHPRCVELAWKFSMPLRVCTSLIEQPDFAHAKLFGTKGSSVDALNPGTIIEGIVEKNLESSQIHSVAIQKNLIKVEISGFSDALKASAYFATLVAQGFRHVAWALEKDTLQIVMEESYRHFLKENVSMLEQTSLNRISVIGSGLSHQPETLVKMMQILNAHGAIVTESHLGSTFIDVLFKLSSEKIDKLLQNIHSELIS